MSDRTFRSFLSKLFFVFTTRTRLAGELFFRDGVQKTQDQNFQTEKEEGVRRRRHSETKRVLRAGKRNIIIIIILVVLHFCRKHDAGEKITGTGKIRTRTGLLIVITG